MMWRLVISPEASRQGLIVSPGTGLVAGIGSGAVIGGAAGSVIPGVGQAIGAGIGSIIGGVGSIFAKDKKVPQVRILREVLFAALDQLYPGRVGLRGEIPVIESVHIAPEEARALVREVIRRLSLTVKDADDRGDLALASRTLALAEDKGSLDDRTILIFRAPTPKPAPAPAGGTGEPDPVTKGGANGVPQRTGSGPGIGAASVLLPLAVILFSR